MSAQRAAAAAPPQPLPPARNLTKPHCPSERQVNPLPTPTDMTTLVLQDTNQIAYLHDVRRRLEYEGHIDRRRPLAERLGEAYHLVHRVQRLEEEAADKAARAADALEDEDEKKPEDPDEPTLRTLRAAPLIRAMRQEEQRNHYRTLRLPSHIAEEIKAWKLDAPAPAQPENAWRRPT